LEEQGTAIGDVLLKVDKTLNVTHVEHGVEEAGGIRAN